MIDVKRFIHNEYIISRSFYYPEYYKKKASYKLKLKLNEEEAGYFDLVAVKMDEYFENSLNIKTAVGKLALLTSLLNNNAFLKELSITDILDDFETHYISNAISILYFNYFSVFMLYGNVNIELLTKFQHWIFPLNNNFPEIKLIP